MDCIIHIGAGKCGSSSLQTAMSLEPVISGCNNSIKYEYICITPQGKVLRKNALIKNTIEGTHGYSSSCQMDNISEDTLNYLRKCFHEVKTENVIPIISYEGWIYEDNIFSQKEILPKLDLQAKVILFVRPQISWLNSAWWQWGAWSGKKFDDWLSVTNSAAQWTDFIQRWQNVPGVESVEVHLATKDVVKTFYNSIGATLPNDTLSNRSLGGDIIRFLQRNREFRPHEHAPHIEFILERNLPTSNIGTPWVIPKKKIAELIEYYREGNQKLLSFLPKIEQQEIENDSRWWDAKAYDHFQVSASGQIEPNIEEVEELARRAIQAVVDLDHKLRASGEHPQAKNISCQQEHSETMPVNLRKVISLNGIRRFLGVKTY